MTATELGRRERRTHGDAAGPQRERLVGQLEERGCLQTNEVREAFLNVRRELFVPEFATKAGLDAVYRDEALPAKLDRAGRWISSSSQPAIMAEMLERLQLQRGHRVLEVGTGTGYNAALMAAIVGKEGRVVSIEIDRDLAKHARAALSLAGFDVVVIAADGRRGWPSGAPYDRIMVTASIAETPRAWFEQTRDAGLVEVPLSVTGTRWEGPQAIVALERRNGHLALKTAGVGSFMPVRGASETMRSLPPTLAANETVRNAHRLLAMIDGPGISRLGSAGRKRLLALALTRPSRTPLRGAIVQHEPLPMWPFLQLSGLADWAIRMRRSGILASGTVAVDAAGLALVCAPTGPNGQLPTPHSLWIESYGAEEPTAKLQDLIGEWRALKEPGLMQLDLTIRYGKLDHPIGWRTFRRGESEVTVDWRRR